MNAARKRLLAPHVFAGVERETALCLEAGQALATARALVQKVSDLQLDGEEIAWFLAEALLDTTLDARRDNVRREALAIAAALNGVRAVMTLQLQTQIDAASRRAEG